MENKKTGDKTFEKFTWTIRDFSKLDSKKLYSDKFSLDDHTWRILIFPKGNNVDCLSIYLDAGGDLVNLPDGWIKFANFKLALINQIYKTRTRIREAEHEFDAKEIDWGFTRFIPLNELCDPSNGFLVNDTCIIEVEILVSKSKHEDQIKQPVIKIDDKPKHENQVNQQIHKIDDKPKHVNQEDQPINKIDDNEKQEDQPINKIDDDPKHKNQEDQPINKIDDKPKHENQVDQPVNKIEDELVEQIDNLLPKEMFTTFGEQVDFRGLGKIEQELVPLLDEVCSRHPSLINNQKKRTRRYIEWAFTALGRVLYFLKTTKVKDMDDNACNHLKILWEELETFRFDLTWLEPHIQTVLGMKNLIEKTIQVKKMKENVTALEMETKMLRAKMIEAEVNLEIARRELVKVNEGFEECNLDAELGYGGQ